jgi:hypothetical protein
LVETKNEIYEALHHISTTWGKNVVVDKWAYRLWHDVRIIQKALTIKEQDKPIRFCNGCAMFENDFCNPLDPNHKCPYDDGGKNE